MTTKEGHSAVREIRMYSLSIQSQGYVFQFIATVVMNLQPSAYIKKFILLVLTKVLSFFLPTYL